MGKEHYTKNTAQVRAWCKRCERPTMHQVDAGRLGPCLDCIDKLEEEHKAKAEFHRQRRLFGEVE